MADEILHPGPPVLTIAAADAGIDLIDMIAMLVRGVDQIEVTDAVRLRWRTHLAGWYAQLPEMTRNWYANAPQLLIALRAQWPLLQPAQQATLLQQWRSELPQMMFMIDPVLAHATPTGADAEARKRELVFHMQFLHNQVNMMRAMSIRDSTTSAATGVTAKPDPTPDRK